MDPGRNNLFTASAQAKFTNKAEYKSNVISCSSAHYMQVARVTRSNHRMASWQKKDRDYLDIVQGLAELNLKTCSVTRIDVQMSHFLM